MIIGNYFTVNRSLIIRLLFSGISADLLCCWLILAKNSDKSNSFSYASVDSISKILEIGRPKAKAIINDLLSLKQWKPAATCYASYENLNKKKHFLLPKYGANKVEEVYFANKLVGNKSDGNNKIKLIYRNEHRDCLIRTIIVAHLMYRSTFCATSPSVVYISSNVEKSKIHENYYLGVAKIGGNTYTHASVVRLILGTYDDGNNQPLTASEAKHADLMFDWLAENGFLRKSIMVIDARSKEPLYELDTKGVNNRTHRNCGVAEEIIRTHNLRAGRGETPPFRFVDRYPFIAPSECEPIVLGLYRPTFFPSCPSLRIVQQAQSNQSTWQATVDKWFSELIETRDKIPFKTGML